MLVDVPLLQEWTSRLPFTFFKFKAEHGFWKSGVIHTYSYGTAQATKLRSVHFAPTVGAYNEVVNSGGNVCLWCTRRCPPSQTMTGVMAYRPKV